MPITGNSTYVDTIQEFNPHWESCNEELGAVPLIIRLPDNSTVTQAELGGMWLPLWQLQMAVQRKLADVVLSRGKIDQQKAALLKQFNGFCTVLEGYYQGTRFLAVRPRAPGLGMGQERFTGPLLDAATLWKKVNEAPAPAGVSLPIVLADGTDQAGFAAAIEALEKEYKAARAAAQDVALAREDRDELQDDAYAIMKAYRQAVPVRMAEFPVFIETLPRLTPLPGHTPEPVEARVELVGPREWKVEYGVSEEATLYRYQLRGNVGDVYNHADAMVLATNEPGAPREFVTDFGLNRPGVKMAFKVYVILSTGNEAGSETMVVEREAKEAG